MKYSITQLGNGNYAVKVGRETSDRIKYIPDTETDNKNEAQDSADFFNALDMLEKVNKITEKISDIEKAKEIAQEAYDVTNTYEIRAESEDEDFDPQDPKGYLA